MKIEQTILQKTFTVVYNRKTYFVNYLNSDGQTENLINQNNWEIYEEDRESLNIHYFKSSDKKQKLRAKKNVNLARKLIKFCIEHFENYNPVKEDY